MELLFTDQFDKAYQKLSKDDKKSVQKFLQLLGNDPGYPGLHTRKMKGSKRIWEARPSARLRITFEISGQTITVRNVGEHDRVLKNP